MKKRYIINRHERSIGEIERIDIVQITPLLTKVDSARQLRALANANTNSQVSYHFGFYPGDEQ